MSSKKVVVYTALVGDYDYLRPVPKGLEDFDFVCFTDGSVSDKACENRGWIPRSLPKVDGSSRKTCRVLKSMPQEYLNEYDISIWLDSNISFNSGINDLVNAFTLSDSLVRGFRHPIRNCPYVESDECVRQGKDTAKNINLMINHMRASGFPEDHGLTETNVLFRKHHVEKVRSFNEDWSRFLTDFTIRDQISFDYLCWHHGIDVWYFEGSTHCNEHSVFNRGLHRSDNKIKDTFAYFESFQGVFPSLGRVINLIYTILE